MKPYWGKLTVRNFRGGDGDVGIIRSPVRAIALPDRGIAEVLGTKLDTVRAWLQRAAEQSARVNALILRELNVSQVELDALWTFVKKKAAAPASDPLEGEVWVGVSLASRFRLIFGWALAASEAALAGPLIAATEAKLATDVWPLWLSDGLEAYGTALKARHCVLQSFPRTGRPGRPRRP